MNIGKQDREEMVLLVLVLLLRFDPGHYWHNGLSIDLSQKEELNYILSNPLNVI